MTKIYKQTKNRSRTSKKVYISHIFSLSKNKLFGRSVQVLLFICLIALVTLQFHNSVALPITRGFDPYAHMEYIQYIQKNHTLPSAANGWEMYQPPLYYLIASILPNMRAVIFIGFVSYLVLISVSYMTFKKLFTDKILSLIGTVVVAATPAIIYISPSISNEFFATVLISITFAYYLTHRDLKTIEEKLLLGVCIGLSLMAKATALLLPIAIILDQFLYHKNNLKLPSKTLILSLVIAIIIGGGHYIRNTIIYHNPVVAPKDLPTVFEHNQTVTPRDFSFFTDLSPFFKLDMFQAHHYAFWPGTYFSWFYDGHNLVVPVQPFSKAGIALILISLPIAAGILIGLWLTLRDKKVNLFPSIYAILLFVSYILYNFKLPYYSTVKGIFLSSAVLLTGYFFIVFLKKYSRLIPFASVLVICYTLLVLKNFWILNFWYK